MAEEIQLNIKVGGSASLATLKKDFKDLQDQLTKTTQGTKEYYVALSRLGEVKDQMNDLREEINALNPGGKIAAFSSVANNLAGGFQAATGAAALFGVKAGEVEQALLKVQAASALAQGIQSLEGFARSLEVVGVVIRTQVVTALATLKGALIATGIGAAVVALGALIYAANEYNEAVEKEADSQKKLNDELKVTGERLQKNNEEREALRNETENGLNQLQRELKLLQAKGATDEEIAAKRKEIVTEEIFNLKSRLFAVREVGGSEVEFLKQIRDKKTELEVIDAEIGRKRKERYLAEKRTRKELLDQEAIDAENYFNREAEKEDARLNKLAADKQRENELLESYLTSAQQTEDRLAEENKAKRKKDIEDQANAKVQAGLTSFNAIQGLSQAFYQSELNSAKGNATETEKIRKKQFETEKAFNVARAIIDGYRSVQAALVIPPPAGQILAAANALASAANVAKILSTQYNSTQSSAGGSIPSVSAGGGSAPIPTAPQIINRQDSTNLSENGYNLTVNARVYEGQMTETQRRINKLQGQASF